MPERKTLCCAVYPGCGCDPAEPCAVHKGNGSADHAPRLPMVLDSDFNPLHSNAVERPAAKRRQPSRWLTLAVVVAAVLGAAFLIVNQLGVPNA